MTKSLDIKKIVLILVVIAVVSIAAALSILVSEGGPMGLISAQQHNIDEEKSFPVEGITDIRLTTVSEDIQVIPSDSGEIRIRYYGYSNNQPELSAVVRGNQLTIQTDHDPKLFRIFNLSPANLKLELHLPKSYTSKLQAGTISGNSDFPDLNLSTFSFHSVSGDLTAETLNAQRTMLETTSGDIKIGDLQGALDHRSVSGDLMVSSSFLTGNLQISTVSGDARISLPDEAGFQFDFSSTSGDINSNFPITRGLSRGNHDAYGTVGSGEHRLTVNTVSGDLEIVKN
ncbi:MAG: DUF4097 family beta strand repeat-containing protein [Bacillota bacterium]